MTALNIAELPSQSTTVMYQSLLLAFRSDSTSKLKPNRLGCDEAKAPVIMNIFIALGNIWDTAIRCISAMWITDQIQDQSCKDRNF